MRPLRWRCSREAIWLPWTLKTQPQGRLQRRDLKVRMEVLRPAMLAAWILLFQIASLTGAMASTPCPAATVQVLEDDRLLPAIFSMVQSAQREIWVGAYHFKAGVHPRSGPDRLAQELIKARKRGVAVTVVLDRPEDPFSEQAMENHKTASLLQKGGVVVYLDRPQRRSHMKVMVVDGRFTVVGSHNLTQSGLRRNHELSLSVDSPCVAERTVNYLKQIVRQGGGRVP